MNNRERLSRNQRGDKVEEKNNHDDRVLLNFRAQQSLIEIYEQINQNKLLLPRVTFTGLSHFRHQVLFIDPVRDAHFDSLTRIAGRYQALIDRLFIFSSELCRETYQKNGIPSTDQRPFQPHLTLFKLSKAPALYRTGK